MSTYGILQDRIADELDRSDLTSQIQKAILSAIDYYESERFFFNETRAITFTTSSSQEFYTVTDVPDIANIQEIDKITVTVSGNRYALTPRTYDYLEEISIGTVFTTLPRDYSFYANQLRFYPIPNSAVPVRISGIIRQSTLSATTDSNVWTTTAEQLIRARSKADIYLNVLHDAQSALEMQTFEKQIYDDLIGTTERMRSTNSVRPSHF